MVVRAGQLGKAREGKLMLFNYGAGADTLEGKKNEYVYFRLNKARNFSRRHYYQTSSDLLWEYYAS